MAWFRASSTSSAVIEVETRHPTIRRAKTSTTIASAGHQVPERYRVAVSQTYNILILRDLPRARAITHSREPMMPDSDNTKPTPGASNESESQGKASVKRDEVRPRAGLREVLRVFSGWDENDEKHKRRGVARN